MKVCCWSNNRLKSRATGVLVMVWYRGPFIVGTRRRLFVMVGTFNVLCECFQTAIVGSRQKGTANNNCCPGRNYFEPSYALMFSHRVLWLSYKATFDSSSKSCGVKLDEIEA